MTRAPQFSSKRKHGYARSTKLIMSPYRYCRFMRCVEITSACLLVFIVIFLIQGYYFLALFPFFQLFIFGPHERDRADAVPVHIREQFDWDNTIRDDNSGIGLASLFGEFFRLKHCPSCGTSVFSYAKDLVEPKDMYEDHASYWPQKICARCGFDLKERET